MESDSEREKSSDPNELTSSDDKTFHDNDDDDDSNDSSVPELEIDNMGSSKNKIFTGKVEFNESKKMNQEADSIMYGKSLTIAESDVTQHALASVKVTKNDGNLADSSESEGELEHIKNSKIKKKLTCVEIEKQQQKHSFEAIQNNEEIDGDDDDNGILFPVKVSNKLDIKTKLNKSDSDVEMWKVPLKQREVVVTSLQTTNEVMKLFEEVECGASKEIDKYEVKIPESCRDIQIAIDEENLPESVRESAECFYSAQDLLEYGHLLTCEFRTSDIESGYFEKSESDISRDENEANTSRKIKPRSTPKPRSNQSKSMSESLRIELNRFKAMIESIERESLSNNEANRQDTIGYVLSAEKNYNESELKTIEISNDVKGNRAAQRGYWSTVFGQASQIESGAELTLDERFSDIKKAHRALELLEDYHSRLSEPQDRALRIAIERVIRIFKSRLFQALLERNFMLAYRHQSQSVQAVVKMLQQLKEENWCLPVMYTVCLDLRILAQKCEEINCSSNKPGEIMEKAADCLMSCFRVCAADNRSTNDDTKRLGMLNLVNQLFKVYFRINKLHLCKPLIRAIDSSAFKDSFPLPEQITYKYFVGRKAMFDSDYKSADEFLSFALKNCPRNFPRNKRLILIYLVPVKMLLGYMPKKHILERFDVLQFHELAEALKEGNVRKFDEVIQRHESFFIKCGIYLLVEKLKFIVYRNLFKRVYLIKQTHQLDLNDFRAALQFVGETDMSIDETHCIVANLIFEGKVKGYISHSHNKLVVSKQNPFPPLNTVS